MRRATSANAPRGAATAQVFQFPPPVGGLNTRDPTPMVPPTECISVSNFFPSATGMVLRRGYSTHTSGSVTPESLMVYTNNSGTETLFAAIGTAFYDVTSSGALGAAVQSGLTNARWQSTNFTNSSGTSYLCCFNGADSPRYWDGATWTTITGASTPAITGLTTSTIISAAVHQRRMWLIQVNSLKAWYLPIDSVGGAAAALDLGGIASKGGYIVAMASWTIDGGDGLDDYLLCVTSKGQMIVFQGTDPSSAATWQHVGTWNIAAPIGRRCLSTYKADVLIITKAGVASTVRIMGGDTSSSGMLTDKISGSYSSLASSADATTFGWSLFYFPAQDMLLLSIPTVNTYVMNTVTGAWGYFALGVLCWALFQNLAYYGNTSHGVRKFWNSALDSGSAAITGTLAHGFSDFGVGAAIKKSTLARALVADQQYNVGIITGADFRNPITPTTSLSLTGASNFDITPWLPVTASGQVLTVAFAATSVNNSSGLLAYSGAIVSYNPGAIVGATVGL